jgi:predicted membrane channel-forming protein YqfA (hemolysin III family)
MTNIMNLIMCSLFPFSVFSVYEESGKAACVCVSVVLVVEIGLLGIMRSRSLCESAFDSLSCVGSRLAGSIHDLLAESASCDSKMD